MATNPSSGCGENSSVVPLTHLALDRILRDCGVDKYDPDVINTLTELSHQYIRRVIEDADDIREHSGDFHYGQTTARRPITTEDINLASQLRLRHSYRDPAAHGTLQQFAHRINSTKLPDVPIRMLPPEEHCLNEPNTRIVVSRGGINTTNNNTSTSNRTGGSSLSSSSLTSLPSSSANTGHTKEAIGNNTSTTSGLSRGVG